MALLSSRKTGEVTVILPTWARHGFMSRVSDHLGDAGLRVIVADSSRSPQRHSGAPHGLEYHHFPDLPFIPKLAAALGLVKTPVLVLCADDDFLVPEAIVRCGAILAAEPAVSSAYGKYLTLCVRAGKLPMRPEGVCHENSLVGRDAPDRLRRYLAAYMQLFYAVQRTENLQLACDLSGTDLVRRNLQELMMGVVLMPRGELRATTGLYGVRQFIRGSAAATTPGTISWCPKGNTATNSNCSWLDAAS